MLLADHIYYITTELDNANTGSNSYKESINNNTYTDEPEVGDREFEGGMEGHEPEARNGEFEGEFEGDDDE